MYALQLKRFHIFFLNHTFCTPKFYNIGMWFKKIALLFRELVHLHLHFRCHYLHTPIHHQKHHMQ